MWLSTVGVYLLTYCTIFGRVQIPGRHFFQRMSDEKYARAAACKCLSRTRGKKSSTSASHRGVTDDGPIPHDGLPKACRALLCSCLFCVGQGPQQYEPLTAQSKVGELQELTGLKPISEPTPCRPKHMAWKVSKALNSAPIPS
ncbi:hypothetical protein IWX49DRAFT_142103 [Phyllosticta citricarpa]